jgi:hypothetical protein
MPVIADMIVPPGTHPFDAAAFTDQFTRHKAKLRLRIKAVQIIKSRLKARCLNYASQIERQLDLQQKNQGFLDLVQNEVNNFFKAQPRTSSSWLRRRDEWRRWLSVRGLLSCKAGLGQTSRENSSGIS